MQKCVAHVIGWGLIVTVWAAVLWFMWGLVEFVLTGD